VVDYESGESMEPIMEVPLKELGESEKHGLVMRCMYVVLCQRFAIFGAL